MVAPTKEMSLPYKSKSEMLANYSSMAHKKDKLSGAIGLAKGAAQNYKKTGKATPKGIKPAIKKKYG